MSYALLRRVRRVRRVRRGVLVVAAAASLAACTADPTSQATSSTTIGASAYIRGDVSTLTYRAVDLMLAQAPDVLPTTPLLVGSVTSTENMQTSSSLDNIISEMIRTRLVQDGHSSTELRLRRDVSFGRGKASSCWGATRAR